MSWAREALERRGLRLMSEPSSKRVIAVALRPQLYAGVRVVCDDEDCSVSDLVRSLLKARVRAHGLDPLGRSGVAVVRAE
jgi:hypothetical protein